MLISVIIPVYNAEKYLKKCLESVRLQTFDDWEVIAIDDGSTDNSFTILQYYASLDKRFRIARQTNVGPGETRNRAMDKAEGDMIVFIDSDDYIENDYFQLLSERMSNGADVVFIDIIQEKPNGEIIRLEKMSKFKNKSKTDMIGCQMTGYMPWGGVRKAVSRNLIEKNQLRYTTDPVGEEAIFSFEMLRNAQNIAFIEKNLYHYVNHPGSQSKTPIGTWEVTLKKMRQHMEANGIKQEYRVHLASFAFVVLISWLLKYSKVNSLDETWRCLCEKRKEYISEYSWQLNPDYIRKDVRILIPFVRMHLLLPIVVAAGLSKH